MDSSYKHHRPNDQRRRRPQRPQGLRPAALVVCLLLARAAGLTPTHADPLPPERRSVVLLRTLSYDRRLRDRAGAELVLAVLFRRGQLDSEAMAQRTVSNLVTLAGQRVQGLPLRFTRVPYLSPDTLRAAVSAQGVDILYLCTGLEGDVEAITEVSRQMKLLTIGGVESLVSRGISLGVFALAERVAILINLGASRKEGVDFSPELLQLAEVLR